MRIHRFFRAWRPLLPVKTISYFADLAAQKCRGFKCRMAAVNAVLFGKIFRRLGEVEFFCGNNCNGSGTRVIPGVCATRQAARCTAFKTAALHAKIEL
ncbi:hypothetical protein [Burkholderia sp. MSMB1589WGS]|uniref:hypothetical protein n=1 Tax=Burkholderia sp. MSMB1589WGS TaxID=1636425 RepID=UPI0012E90D33|nr:hypothetical protein [Burkholderia sp. MSMB1589WGS]